MPLTHGFELIREETIHELNTVARRYRHAKTGADLLSLQNDDENKVFGIAFRTPPQDSTGLPHIMEHSVLCGSRKYPLKEPFTELLKGSLKTFLNAFTSPDRTVYPVASANLQDFYNLVDVYLDAVFFPRIGPEVLAQEGWHFEMDGPEDDLRFKGVVFNEMKGAYSSPDSLLYRYARQALFPDTVYANDSGGDPGTIPDLTYAQFKRFHETYYHPTNSMIFFSGDDDPTERLRLLDAYLSEFDAIDLDASVAPQPAFDMPRQAVFGFDAGQTDDRDGSSRQAMAIMEWAMPDEVSSPAEMMLVSILSYSLVGTSAAPLRKALIDSGLGESMTGGGFSDGLRQMTFSAGLKGMDPIRVEDLEALIITTLDELAQEGIDPETIEAAINTLEFNLRENNTGSFPRGLAMMMRVLGEWAHGQDPVDHLAFEEPLAQAKAMLADQPDILQERIRRYMLNNPHRATVLMRPDPKVAMDRENAELARLGVAWAAMTPDDVLQVIADTHRLRLAQETPDSPEALATIPTLTLDDLPRTEKPIPTDESTLQGSRVLFHDIFANGIVYLDLGFDLHTLPQELLPYVPLFSRALLQMGTADEDYVKLTQRIGRKTGGIWLDRLESARLDSSEAVAHLLMRGKSTVAQVPDMLAIMGDVLGGVRLDNPQRFRQLVLESKAHKESGLIPGGHSVVNDRLRAAFNEADWLSEQWDGVSGLFFLRKLAQDMESDWPAILEKLEAIRAALLNRNAMLCNITTDAEGWDHVRPALDAFLADLPAAPVQRMAWQRPVFPAHEGLTIPAQVNYVGKGVNLYDLGYTYHGSMIAITNFLRTGYLWEKIRVQGGAYGGFVSFDRRAGVYSYLSYRDPNLTNSLDIYDSVGAYLRQVELPQEELTKSIIGAIGQLDAYQMPDAKGYTALMRELLGSTAQERQRIRDEVLSTSTADFRQLGQALGDFSAAGRVVVLGSADAIGQANLTQLNNQLIVQKVL